MSSERRSSLSSTLPGIICTPTHTSLNDTPPTPSEKPFTINGGVTSVPENGHTYMIREVDSGRAITLVNGRLTLVLDAGTRGGWHWCCEEHSSGWIGFRDAVSGKYLGHDNKGGYMVRAEKLRAWESFVLRPREKGGYNLFVKDWDTLKPMGVDNIDGQTPRLVNAPSLEKAARWEFVEV
ncbi:hypothetical protein F4802DRAFT_265218 [Xylaria palmicola]|nr:hypothetical protein F4802DRAFT_265218 [Xylaria palmicola]